MNKNLKELKDLFDTEKQYEFLVEQYLKIEKNFSVVIIGQQNNGKSTLCNALCQDWSNQKFPVADRRLTETIQEEFDEHTGIVYVDTPGFSSANKDDDANAQKEWNRANLLILVHSVRSGELDADEVNIIKKLKLNVPELEKRLFIVCSKVGEEDSKRVDEVLSAVRKYLRDDLRLSVPVEAIDSKDYIEGKLINDADLIASSNIISIIEWIDENRGVSCLLEDTIKTIKKQITIQAKKIKNSISESISELNKQKNNYKEHLKSCWVGNKFEIKNAWDKCSIYTEKKDKDDDTDINNNFNNISNFFNFKS